MATIAEKTAALTDKCAEYGWTVFEAAGGTDKTASLGLANRKGDSVCRIEITAKNWKAFEFFTTNKLMGGSGDPASGIAKLLEQYHYCHKLS